MDDCLEDSDDIIDIQQNWVKHRKSIVRFAQLSFNQKSEKEKRNLESLIEKIEIGYTQKKETPLLVLVDTDGTSVSLMKRHLLDLLQQKENLILQKIEDEMKEDEICQLVTEALRNETNNV